jgi:hypothetical protein
MNLIDAGITCQARRRDLDAIPANQWYRTVSVLDMDEGIEVSDFRATAVWQATVVAFGAWPIGRAGEEGPLRPVVPVDMV